MRGTAGVYHPDSPHLIARGSGEQILLNHSLATPKVSFFRIRLLFHCLRSPRIHWQWILHIIQAWTCIQRSIIARSERGGCCYLNGKSSTSSTVQGAVHKSAAAQCEPSRASHSFKGRNHYARHFKNSRSLAYHCRKYHHRRRQSYYHHFQESKCPPIHLTGKVCSPHHQGGVSSRNGCLCWVAYQSGMNGAPSLSICEYTSWVTGVLGARGKQEVTVANPSSPLHYNCCYSFPKTILYPFVLSGQD